MSFLQRTIHYTKIAQTKFQQKLSNHISHIYLHKTFIREIEKAALGIAHICSYTFICGIYEHLGKNTS